MASALERQIAVGAVAVNRFARERNTALALVGRASQDALMSFQSAFNALRFDSEVARLAGALGPNATGIGLTGWIHDQRQFGEETLDRLIDTLAQTGNALLHVNNVYEANWASISRAAGLFTDGLRRSYEGAFAEMAGMKGVLTQAAEAFARIRAPGTFLGDYLVATDASAPEDERMAVLDHMQEHWFRTPIHPRRWPMVRPELERRAAAAGSTVKAELRATVRQSLLLAFDDIDEAPIDELLNICRTRLANLLTDELAGPGWRQRQKGALVSFDELDGADFHDDLDVAYQIEVMQLYEKLWTVMTDLPKRARSALLAKIEGRALTNAEHQAMFRLRGSAEFRALQEQAS